MHKPTILPAMVLSGLLVVGCQGPQGNAAGNGSMMQTSANEAIPGGNPPMSQANSASPMAVPAPTDAPTYIAKAGAGDLFEIESSRAVLGKSKNAKVTEFAKMMIKQHQDSTAKVKAAAAKAKLTVPAPILLPDQQAMLDQIKTADAASVDTVYLRHQQTAHEAALALHQGYAETGDTPALNAAAAEIATVVKTHIGHLADMQAR
ncbi:DUF4142 domain-containing protein [Sphingobium sp.]|uniref:DUF4142 domain-containing protein n=1 Tax=Sphingobium sp. TaxID=1912891 RepID=UPI002BF08E53|nr:DUF4142 domain-containing protein [Sphingobium sp.]HUD94923.1 DUF4142 domain-containing protein [Sphingobium sp.]